MIDAIGRRDYPVVQGGLLLIGVIVMVVNLVVDLLYGVINPRIRHMPMTSPCRLEASTVAQPPRSAALAEFWRISATIAAPSSASVLCC